ncbi:B3 domain-containing protein At2g31720-like [Solanum lycopersicum]|uniref:TF-B3 domain-containing protein n=1 Tax=Solanum lycopersicum TaxID=4081 RepID=A0A3Q7EMI5_SOLLC
MTTIRLFGNNITVLRLFGVQFSPLNNNNVQQRDDRVMNMPDLLPPSLRLNIESVRGSEPVHMGRKYLENSDTNSSLSRFLIPAECATNLLQHMTESEREKIQSDDDKGIDISVMDPKGDLHNMKFTEWKSLKRLVFNRGWNKLVENNQLHKGDLLSLWHYRSFNNKPCFAVNIIPKPKQ